MSKKDILIGSNEAKKIVLDQANSYGTEQISLNNALGRILAESIYADRDFPPFNRASMDGYALNNKESKNEFFVQDIQFAGESPKTLKSSDNCIEIMTGAMVPENCNAIIPYEKTKRINNKISINNTLTIFENIHQKGVDKKKGDLIINKGEELTAAKLGIAASVGKSRVRVEKLPRIIIISTGDELVSVDKTPKEYQIRRSNDRVIEGILMNFASTIEIEHWTDTFTKELIAEKILTADILIFSGGVSKGKKDFVAPLLLEAKVKKLFHGVLQRPGKPLFFGKHPSGTIIFALPGNPVSSMVSTIAYIKPFIQSCLGKKQIMNFATLKNDIIFKPQLDYFMSVKITNENGKIYAEIVEGNGSGDFSHLVEVDGFLKLPSKEEILFKKEEVYEFLWT